MRTRKKAFTFYMNDKEYQRLTAQSKKSGLCRSDFLRDCIMNVEIKERLPDEFGKIYSLLAKTGSNVNQIAKHANATGYIDPNKIDALIILFNKCWDKIEDI